MADETIEQLTQLFLRWIEVTGDEIPREIAMMPIPDIERRLALLEDKNTLCFVPRKTVAVVDPDESMAAWDSQDSKHLNSYGS